MARPNHRWQIIPSGITFGVEVTVSEREFTNNQLQQRSAAMLVFRSIIDFFRNKEYCEQTFILAIIQDYIGHDIFR